MSNQNKTSLYLLLSSILFGLLSSYSFVSEPLSVVISMIGSGLLFAFLIRDVRSTKSSIIQIDFDIRSRIESKPILFLSKFNDLNRNFKSQLIANVGIGAGVSGMASNLFLNGFTLSRAMSQKPGICNKQSGSSMALEDIGVTAVSLCTMVGFGAYILSAQSLQDLTRVKSDILVEELKEELRVEKESDALGVLSSRRIFDV